MAKRRFAKLMRGEKELDDEMKRKIKALREDENVIISATEERWIEVYGKGNRAGRSSIG